MTVQPSYKLGEEVYTKEKFEYKGRLIQQEMKWCIVGVKAVGTDTGFEYKYLLGNIFPAAYMDPNNTEWLYEDKFYTKQQGMAYDT